MSTAVSKHFQVSTKCRSLIIFIVQIIVKLGYYETDFTREINIFYDIFNGNISKRLDFVFESNNDS